jgi:hypothetical protein
VLRALWAAISIPSQHCAPGLIMFILQEIKSIFFSVAYDQSFVKVRAVKNIFDCIPDSVENKAAFFFLDVSMDRNDRPDAHTGNIIDIFEINQNIDIAGYNLFFNSYHKLIGFLTIEISFNYDDGMGILKHARVHRHLDKFNYLQIFSGEFPPEPQQHIV